MVSAASYVTSQQSSSFSISRFPSFHLSKITGICQTLKVNPAMMRGTANGLNSTFIAQQMNAILLLASIRAEQEILLF
jgi:hypothetical protein